MDCMILLMIERNSSCTSFSLLDLIEKEEQRVPTWRDKPKYINWNNDDRDRKNDGMNDTYDDTCLLSSPPRVIPRNEQIRSVSQDRF